MDNLIKYTGEDKIRRFLQTLTDQEKLELVEEVRRMIEFKTLDLDKIEKEKPSTEFNLIDGYF